MAEPTINELENEISLLKTRVQELSSLIEVSIIINSSLNPDRVIQLVMEKAKSVMNAEATSVFLVNNEIDKLECEVAIGKVGEKVLRKFQLARGQGVAGWVWENKKPLIVKDVSKDTRFFSGVDEISGFKTRSLIAVPLMVQDNVIGVAEVINRADGKNFTNQDIDLFSTFGRQVALAIDNAKMHKLALEQERLRQQLEAAREIQQSFMPQVLPSSSSNRFQLAASNITADAVGGDFYDAILLDDRRLGLLIGDVSGKGVPAALHMARMMNDFRFFVQQKENPHDLLQLLNDTLVDRGHPGMFITMQFALINLDNGIVSFANAGHLPVLLVKSQNPQAVQVRGEQGAPLAISKNIEFKTVQFSLQKGDFLFFYTDGLIEMRNRAGQQFSLERLIAESSQNWPSAQAFLHQIIAHVLDYTDQFPRHDDVTAMAFQWNG